MSAVSGNAATASLVTAAAFPTLPTSLDGTQGVVVVAALAVEVLAAAGGVAGATCLAFVVAVEAAAAAAAVMCLVGAAEAGVAVHHRYGMCLEGVGGVVGAALAPPPGLSRSGALGEGLVAAVAAATSLTVLVVAVVMILVATAVGVVVAGRAVGLGGMTRLVPAAVAAGSAAGVAVETAAWVAAAAGSPGGITPRGMYLVVAVGVAGAAVAAPATGGSLP